eukprot:TRINITY_DN5091_c0_g1_i1.p1 TRINITY_DN5091_c0_g1~~TRINITY_DN5091_c0_g1_i1.p1  ORF type:complete len:314 (+),score=38.11 TRINITY_DN5091_c0_g1_i1:56-943(+)
MSTGDTSNGPDSATAAQGDAAQAEATSPSQPTARPSSQEGSNQQFAAYFDKKKGLSSSQKFRQNQMSASADQSPLASPNGSASVSPAHSPRTMRCSRVIDRKNRSNFEDYDEQGMILALANTMYKQGANVKNWKKRCFLVVETPHTLSYYRELGSNNSLEKKGDIDLMGAVVQANDSLRLPTAKRDEILGYGQWSEFGFTISPLRGGRTFSIVCEDEKLRARWMRFLETCGAALVTDDPSKANPTLSDRRKQWVEQFNDPTSRAERKKWKHDHKYKLGNDLEKMAGLQKRGEIIQ